jgi:CxxC motif-containing protein
LITKKITCICCPLGCSINVIFDGDDYQVIGEQCKRGKDYAIQEVKDPRRVLTTTVKINFGTQKMLPVKSKNEVPKNLLYRCMKILSKVVVEAPIRRGDVIYKNIHDTGIDIISTRDMERM